jgi:hypothetical protein
MFAAECRHGTAEHLLLCRMRPSSETRVTAPVSVAECRAQRLVWKEAPLLQGHLQVFAQEHLQKLLHAKNIQCGTLAAKVCLRGSLRCAVYHMYNTQSFTLLYVHRQRASRRSVRWTMGPLSAQQQMLRPCICGRCAIESAAAVDEGVPPPCRHDDRCSHSSDCSL